MDDMDGKIIDWVWKAVITVVFSLASAVGVLFKLNESKNSRAIASMEKRIQGYEEQAKASDEKHRECLRDRDELRGKVGLMDAEIERQHAQIHEMETRFNLSNRDA